MQYQDIDYLAVTIGPGSFTGIRIGLAVAKGILHASSMQGVAIDNFEAANYRLAMQVREYDTAFIILNAYRHQVYVQELVQDGTKSQPKLMDNSGIADLLKERKGRIVCTGSGLPEIYTEIKNLNNLIILPRFPTIKAIHIARFADNKINKGIFDPIEPLYIRPPDAVIPN